MSRLKQFVTEIHRRSLWQVLGIYVVGAWIAFQVVQTLTEGLGLPEWFPGIALGLLIVLLPVVLATAFVQEGVRGPRRPEAAEPAVREAPPRTPKGLHVAERGSGRRYRVGHVGRRGDGLATLSLDAGRSRR